MRYPRGILGLGKALNFMIFQFQMFLFRILGTIAVQSQKIVVSTIIISASLCALNCSNVLQLSTIIYNDLCLSFDGTSGVNCALNCSNVLVLSATHSDAHATYSTPVGSLGTVIGTSASVSLCRKQTKNK